MEYIRLGDLYKISKGKKVEALEEVNEEAVRYIQIDDLRNDNNLKYCMNSDKYVTVAKNDLVIAWDGANAGTIGYGLEGAIGSTLARLRSDHSNLYTPFIGRFMQGQSKALRDKCTGATIPHIQKSVLEDIQIPKYTFEMQQQMANTLDKAQQLIDKRKEQIEACDELIKSQFIEFFGELKDEVDLSQYIDSLTAGKSLAGEAECKNKVLKTGSVSYDYFDANEVKNLPLDYEPLESHLVKQGNVIISRMNTAELVGATGYVWATPDNTYLPDRLWRAEIKNNVNPIFLWQLLIQDSTKGKIRRIASGTSGSMKNISKQGLLGIKVINVDIEKQNQFASFVQQVDKLKFDMEQSLIELENNFNALMQRAFKGQLF